jgi:Hemolysin-type calcium-binding repeat (2 copies).
MKHINGGGGNDIINAANGNNEIYGDFEFGHDEIEGHQEFGDDVITAGLGNDVIYGGSGDDNINGGNGDNQLYGDAGDDIIISGGGKDIIQGGEGDDQITAGGGNDVIYGGTGKDIVIFSGIVSSYDISSTIENLYQIIYVSGTDGTDKLRGVEILRFDDEDLDLTSGGKNIRDSGQAKLLNINGKNKVGSIISAGELMMTPDGG